MRSCPPFLYNVRIASPSSHISCFYHSVDGEPRYNYHLLGGCIMVGLSHDTYLYQHGFSVSHPAGSSSGALDGGVLMSHVDFKKGQCRMSLSLKIPLVPCRI